MSMNFISKAVGNNKRNLGEEMEPIRSAFLDFVGMKNGSKQDREQKD